MSLCGVVFDLDDTLFLERDYVLSGLNAVALHIAAVTDLESQAVLNELLSIHSYGHRDRVFDAWLEARPSLGGITVAALIDTYRAHQPRISLLSGVPDLLKKLRLVGYKIGLISDGRLTSQRAKVAALGLEMLVDGMVLTDVWGSEFRKPHPRAFELVERELECRPEELAYVGDNPIKDFTGPNSRGWLTIRVRFEGQLWSGTDSPGEGEAPQLELESIDQLASFLLADAPCHPSTQEAPSTGPT